MWCIVPHFFLSFFIRHMIALAWMKKGESTHIRLNEVERRKLEEISALTGLPVSACIRALISAFLNDFEKNKGEIRFPIPMDAALRVWTSLQEEYDIPPYVDELPKLERFLKLLQEHSTTLRPQTKPLPRPSKEK